VENRRTRRRRIRRKQKRALDEHVTRMDVERLVKSQGTIYIPEEDHEEVRKEDGAT
jgi:hypothetical protein